MSGSVGTMRAGSNRHTGPKDKMTKNERNASQQQQQQQHTPSKNEGQSNKIQPTQDQIRLAQMMNTSQSDANPDTVKELMDLTGKGEDDVVIALHDAQNDADRAVMMLLDGGDEQQGEWREQGGKRKKKAASQKEGSNHVGDDHFESRNKDRGDREERDKIQDSRFKDGGSDRQDLPPRRGRRNGGPPPRLARGRGRGRENFGDRDNRDRINTEDSWDNDRGDDKRDRSGGDRGRSRGRGGFGGRRNGGGGRGGRFNNSGDRDNNRSYNRVPRFEKMNNSQPVDGPEIDTWTNETAETNTSKDTDWDNWNESWVNEEDQWTGTLEETKVFTPTQMKIAEPDPVINDPPSSLGQRLDVGSLFSESAKFSKAPDYSKPSGDAYINQFKQAATESIKNTIGIGSSSRTPQSMSSLAMPQPSASNSLGLSSLTSSSQVQDGVPSVLSSLSQQQTVESISLTQLSQFSSQSPMGMGSSQGSQVSGMASQPAQIPGLGSQQQGSRDQVPLSQSRIPSVAQQQQQQNMAQSSLSNNLQPRPKPQRSKLPPPSKIPSTAVEMPGHIPRNPQFDLQFGIDFGTESNSSFSFGSGSNENTTSTSTYSSTSNGSPSVISNHLNQAHVSNSGSDTNSMVSSIMASPSAGTPKVPSNMESQQPSSRPPTVFHNSVYSSTSPKSESQSIEREQNKISGPESMPFPSTQLERKASPMMSSQRPGQQTSQNLSTGSLTPSKNDTSSNNIGSNYSVSNGYASSYQGHQKTSSISQTQAYTHTTNSQPPQGSSFPGQYPASQPTYPPSGQTQFSAPPSGSQYTPSGQPPQFNNTQTQYSSNQNQYVSGGSSSQHPSMPHGSQYSGSTQNAYSSAGQSQYSGYQNNTSFPSHPPSQSNFASSSQTGGPSSSLYPVSTQSSGSSYTSQSNTYQSPSAGSYHSRDNQASATVSTQSSSGVSFPNTAPASSLKPTTSQTNSSYNSQNFNTSPTPLQPSSLANKIGESLSKMTMKDTTTNMDTHQSSQYEHSSTSTTTVSTALSLPSATSTASLSTGTTTISSTSTATSITSTSRIASMPSTSKAPPNLPPGVPLMGQYIMGQSTMPPFYSVQPPLYGYDDVQLLQQRMPLQAGNYYDMAFPAPAGSALPTGRDQQPPIPSVPFSGTTADTSKMPRVDAQSPNSAAQPQNAHSTAQPSLINFHYGYYYPSMFPGAAGLQYPMFPIPPVTNAAHAGTTATTQFQKSYPSHVYTTKGAGTSEMAPNTYNKSHTQGFDKQGFHGGTPPPFNLPLATATQAGPMGAPTTPYGAPFLPVMAAHQAHQTQMMHHPMQQDSGSSSSRGLNQNATQGKSGAAKSYGAPPYWNN